MNIVLFFHRFCIAALGLSLLFIWKMLPAQTLPGSPIKIDLLTTQREYLDTQAIEMHIKIANVRDEAIDAQKGFFFRNFHLLIDFIDPDGRVVRSFAPFGGVEPGPPQFVKDLSGRLRPAVPCERIEAGARNSTVVTDMRVYYDLSKAGPWQARIVTSLQVFKEAVIRSDGSQRCFLDGAPPDAFSPLVSNLVRFNIVRSVPVVESGIQARARQLVIGTGAHPPVSKSNIERMQVKLFKDSQIPDDFRPINHKTYPMIFALDEFRSGVTGTNGVVTFRNIPQGAYVLVALHGGSGITVGAKVDVDEPEWSMDGDISKQLMIIQNSKNKRSPGKATRRRGSDLWVFEPEFVEWDNSQEPYPFVFESIGDWVVTTTVTPPEGFVADHPELSAEVYSETEALQFTITEVGSRWKETKVKHKIKHKGKSEVIESEIGVRLSKRLAKAKSLPIYGETGSPGTFWGGKKIKLDKKNNE